MLKKYFLVLILASIVNNGTLLANCELRYSGYHTIATYQNTEVDYFKNKLKLKFRIFNGRLEILLNPFPASFASQLTSLEKMSSLNRGGETCLIDKKLIKLVKGMLSNEVILEVPICKNIVSSNNESTDGTAFFDLVNHRLLLPKEIGTTPATEIDKSVLEKVEKNIKTFLQDKVFRGGPEIVLLPEEYTVHGFSHSNFVNTKMVISEVTAISTQANKKLNLKFKIVFLSLNGVSWYIADSSYIDPCYEELKGSLKSELNEAEELSEGAKGDSIVNNSESLPYEIFKRGAINEPNLLGWISNLKTGYVYDDPTYPTVIKFERPHILYFVDFGKKLIVIEKDLGEIESMNENSDYGILKTNPIAK